MSPAEIVFGRRLRDNLLFAAYTDRGQYAKRWQSAWAAKEDALRARFVRTAESINRHSRHLRPLKPGDRCFIQDRTGKLAKVWHRTGTVVDVLPYDKYTIRVDGSGRLTNRNRQFLRLYDPVKMTIPLSHPFRASLPDVRNTPELILNDEPTLESRVIPNCSDEVNIVPSHGHDDSSEPAVAEPIMPVAIESSESNEPHRDTMKPPIKRLPLALRRLLDHNKRGLRETPCPIAE